jgi:hypothetical protein
MVKASYPAERKNPPGSRRLSLVPLPVLGLEQKSAAL